jgi:membrane associated rhomboid family serine protease
MFSEIVAGLAQVAVSPEIPSIGASGAVAGLLAGAMLLDPGESLMEEIPIIKWFSIPVVRNFFAITFFAATFFLLEALQTFNTGDGIAHTAHVAGFLTGGFITYYWKPNLSIRGIIISGIYIALFSLAGAGLLQGETLPYGYSISSQIGLYALTGLVLLLVTIRFLSRRGDKDRV